MIECRKVSKKFGSFVALDNVSFSVPNGKCFGFLGQNGAGKTTALRLLVGLLSPERGEILVAGHSLRTERDQAQRLCGYLPQRPQFYPWLTGEEFVRLSAELVGVPVRQAKSMASKYLAMVGLAEFARRRVGKYSGGMQQRLSLAAALIGDPPVLLLDEPVSALDPQGRDEVFALLKQLKQEKTILLSSHILHDVEQVCDGVVIIHRGQIMAQGPLPEVLEQSRVGALSCQVYFEVDRLQLTKLQEEFRTALQDKGISVSNVAWQQQGLEQFYRKIVQEAEQTTGKGGGADVHLAR
ncbi:MAG: ABC transporter ATP-binding protein [Desulfitobacteriaceae bacterium]